MPVVLPQSTVRTPGLPGYYQDKHKYCHLKGAVLKTDIFVLRGIPFTLIKPLDGLGKIN